MKGGFRLRLLSYGAGIALPLASAGLAGIWAVWEANRHQLEDSIRTQAEITAVAFEQWIEAQREPLTTFAAYLDEEPDVDLHFQNPVGLTVNTRPHWGGRPGEDQYQRHGARHCGRGYSSCHLALFDVSLG